MQISHAQLTAHLAKGLRGLYTVVGDEALLVQEATDAIRAAARGAGFTERVVHTAAGAHFDWRGVVASASEMSLFADKQIIDIRVPTGKPGKDGSTALQAIAEAAQDSDDTLTLITLPRLDGATGKSAWVGALDQCGVFIKIDPVERAALPHWIAQRLAQQNQRVQAGEAGQQSLSFFADRVEGNLLAAHQEIQKLGLLYPPGELSFEQVEQAVVNVARYDPFKLTESVLGGQLQRVQRMLDGLKAEGVSPVVVHWALAEEVRALYRVKQSTDAGKPMPVALRENRIWGPRERLIERVIGALQGKQLAQWVQLAHAVDGVVKGLRAPDLPQEPWGALHVLASTVCRACMKTP
jgi:DNA polymerase III subunit delta